MKMPSIVKRRYVLMLLSMATSLALFVGVFELVANIRYHRWKAGFDNYGWFKRITVPSENPVLMWEYRPYGSIDEIETNRYGFRDIDYESTAKPGNTLRIAFVGDSVTLGMGVDFEETFVRRFEAEANRMGFRRRIQALNFAVDSYNTPQICEMIRAKVLGFEPDRVVYMMCMNDFDFKQSSGEKIRYFRKPRSFLLSTIENLYQRCRGCEFHLYHFRRNKDAVFRSILGIRDMLEREGSSLQVVLLPVFFPHAPDFEDYPLRAMHGEIVEYLELNGIRSLDLLDAFASPAETPSYYAADIWHLNARGHRLTARQLASSILSN
jgi:hypothetical protein